MTPYKMEQEVQIDPTIEEFAYGKLPNSVRSKTGIIEKKHYSIKFRCETYLVKFNERFEYWFLENELI